MVALPPRLSSAARPGPRAIVAVAVAVLLACLLAAAWWSTPLPVAVPAGAIVLAVALWRLDVALLLCVACVPLSGEFQFGSIGLDLPLEPVLLLTAGLGLVYVLRRAHVIDGAALRHPISLLLAAHLGWIFLTTLTSVYPMHSWKYLAAKVWYVVPWYVLGGLLLSGERGVKRAILALAVPLVCVLAYCITRHAADGFAFDQVNRAMAPFFRNHVSYAALPSITLPFVLAGAWLFPRASLARWGLIAGALVMLVAIQTSYTRAAYVSVVAGAGFVLVIRWRLTRPALVLALGLAVALGTYLVANNNYLRFAPDYNKAVTQTDFKSLVEATYKLEDISTMERVYRWVAAGNMAAERPGLGFGPGNFVTFYRGYALEHFRTYVSDNPENSGVHSYYLMVVVEQGWLGLAIFLALVLAALVTAERAYHRARTPHERLSVGIAASSLVINLCFQLINDMIETDKAGPWFFYSLAILVAVDLRQARRADSAPA